MKSQPQMPTTKNIYTVYIKLHYYEGIPTIQFNEISNVGKLNTVN